MFTGLFAKVTAQSDAPIYPNEDLKAINQADPAKVSHPGAAGKRVALNKGISGKTKQKALLLNGQQDTSCSD